MLLCIELTNIDANDLVVTTIVTKPDNPYFKTGDKAVIKQTSDWSRITDGNFILIKNELEVMEGFDNTVFKVTFNKKDITLTPLSSFVPFKEKNFSFNEMEKLQLTGKILGIVRTLSNEMKLEEVKMIT